MGWAEVLTTARMRAIEAAAMADGTSGAELMERAGAAVAGAIRLRWPCPGRAVVLCGPGNNGGDGYVVARHLAQAGWRLRVLGMDNTPGPDATLMKRRWAAIGAIAPLTLDELRRDAEPADLYADAIFGTGLTRAPQGEIAAILADLGQGVATGERRLVAVDCPSGLCLDSGAFLGRPREPGADDLRARLTVAFDSPKPGHLLERGPECCGELVIADIGLRPWREAAAARMIAVSPRFDIPDSRRIADGAAALAKAGAGGGHKFTHGHALILAGGFGHGGAARLAARAALRAGAGLVTLGPPRSALIEHAGPPDALMRRGVDDASALKTMLQDARISAVALGPGCGIDRAAMLLDPLLAAKRPCVLDADALTALAERGLDGLHATCVLTPHRGEFARVFPDLAAKLAETSPQGPLYSRIDAVREAAARCGAVVLLKGPDTVIATPDGQARIHSAFDVPWLATAGAGDVLSGIIAGLLARGRPPLDAAATGAFLHAAAARRFGPGLIADDLPDMLPAVFRGLGA